MKNSVDRRGFFKHFGMGIGLVLGAKALSGCDVNLDHEETVLDRLKRLKDRGLITEITCATRNLEGKPRPYVVSIDNKPEQPKERLYWLLTVDGEFIMDVAPDECVVYPHQVVGYYLMRPEQLQA